jgi:hypothetical protein
LDEEDEDFVFAQRRRRRATLGSEKDDHFSKVSHGSHVEPKLHHI